MTTTNHPAHASAKPAPDARSAAASYTAVIHTLLAVEADLDLRPDAGPKVRHTVRRRLLSVPDSVVEGVATLAETHGGALAGISLEAPRARDAMARFTAAETLARALRNFATRVESDAVERKGEVVAEVTAILTALDGFVKTPAGATLAAPLRDLRSVVRTRRSKRAKTVAPSPGAPTETSPSTT
jgi:hypothetical protein